MESVLVIDSAAANAATGEIGRDLAGPLGEMIGWVLDTAQHGDLALHSLTIQPMPNVLAGAPVRSQEEREAAEMT